MAVCPLTPHRSCFDTPVLSGAEGLSTNESLSKPITLSLSKGDQLRHNPSLSLHRLNQYLRDFGSRKFRWR